MIKGFSNTTNISNLVIKRFNDMILPVPLAVPSVLGQCPHTVIAACALHVGTIPNQVLPEIDLQGRIIPALVRIAFWSIMRM